MIHGLLSLLFFIWIFATTLEVISGGKIIPRVWWLRNENAAPACIFCSAAQSFTASKAFDAWQTFEQGRWRKCVASLPYKMPTKDQRAPCDAAYVADWYSLGSRLRSGSQGYYSAAVARFRFAMWAKNGSLFWNQILGSALHLASLIFLLFFALGVEDFYEKMQRRSKGLACLSKNGSVKS